MFALDSGQPSSIWRKYTFLFLQFYYFFFFWQHLLPSIPHGLPQKVRLVSDTLNIIYPDSYTHYGHQPLRRPPAVAASWYSRPVQWLE